jgi:mRNA interferase MazF
VRRIGRFMKQCPWQGGKDPMDICQGEIYWLRAERADGSATDHPHPYVVIQDDLINRSRVPTVVVCALTSNLKRMTEPGNILLEAGEANLSRQSVIVVSQIEAVEKAQLGAYIGALSRARIEQIFAGMRFQQASFLGRD